MRIKLAYGKTGMPLELDEAWNVTLVEPHYVAGLPDPVAALGQALRAPIASPPLCELVKPGDRVGVVFSDLTRPTPNRTMLPVVLEALSMLPKDRITLFNGVGTHRANTPAELRTMLGDAAVDGYRIVQNDAFDPATQLRLGVTRFGHEVWINRQLAECDVKILTGFIEPHLFAGFSGGGKAVMPGMAGLQTVLGNHGAHMVGHPKAIWGITHGNPIWEEIQEAALLAHPSFLVDVTLNKDKQITGVFAGEMDAAHAAGCAFVKDTAMVPVTEAFDIVVTTNSGYPLDLNLYQGIKGVSAAAQVVRQGGAIILAAECWDGIPDHGQYSQLLRAAASPRALLDMIFTPGFMQHDQWEAQVQAQAQLKAEVYVRTDHLSPEQIRAALLEPCHRIEDTVAGLLKRYGAHARICVMPEGPQTIPYLTRPAQ